MFIPLLRDENRVWGVDLGWPHTYVAHDLYLTGVILELPVGMGAEPVRLFWDMSRMQREIQALLIRELPIMLLSGEKIPWFTLEGD